MINETDMYERTPDERDMQMSQQSSSQGFEQQMQERRVTNFISQTSPTNALVKIDWMLKGYVFDEQTSKWQKIAAGIPEQMRLDIVQSLSAHLSEDVRMGRLEGKHINDIMEFLIEWLLDYLDTKADFYLVDAEGEWTLRSESEQIEEREVDVKGYDFESGIVFKYINNYNKNRQILKNISEEDLTKICLIIWSAVFYTLCRALNGVERDRMYNSLKLGDNLSDYAKEDKKKSLLDSFLPWK